MIIIFLHLSSVKGKNNFIQGKCLKCLSVYSKTIKKEENTRGRFGFRAKNLPHQCNIIDFA